MKKYDIVVKLGEYTDQSGQTKGNYKNVGAVMEKNGRPYMILDRTFNPAGIPNPENKESCFLSLFEPKRDNTAVTQVTNTVKPVGQFDDEVPF